MARWDPDGPGPATEQLVFGGRFGVAGGTLAGGLATYDPSTGAWGTVGSASFDSTIYDLVPMPNGDLVAVGFFDYIGSTFVGDVAIWNGTSWSSVGTPFAGGGGQASAAVALLNGNLVVGGNGSIHVWNGASWSSLGGASIGRVSDLVVLPNGSLVAAWATLQFPAGTFNTTVALWTGTGWATLGSGLYSGSRGLRLAVLQNGDLVAAGSSGAIGGLGGYFNCIARWNGTTWSALGAGIGYAPASLLTLANGDLVAGGSFTTAGGSPIAGIARWNGTSWSAIGNFGLRGGVAALQQLANGDLVAGDVFPRPSGTMFTSVASWNGIAWSQLSSSGTDDAVDALVSMPDGSVVAGGAFGCIDGVPARRIARWDGTSWSPLGAGMTAPAGSTVKALARLPNGDLVAGGTFTAVGAVAASNVARWDGSTWFPLGSGLQNSVTALGALPGGNLAAAVIPLLGGPCDVLRWNGVAWSVLGTANQPVNALATAANGDLVATGSFTSIGGVAANNIARWNGTNWLAMGTGLDATGEVLLLLSDGSLLVGGSFTAAGGLTSCCVARWSAAGWSTMNSGLVNGGRVRTLLELPDGDVLAGGQFFHLDPSYGQARNLARWTGTAWYSIGIYTNGEVRSSALAGNGRIAVGGTFSRLGGFSVYVGHVASTCPALAPTTGAGCASSGGANLLAATSLPWIGGTLVTAGSGLPSNALVVVVRGFTPTTVPLPQLLPQGQPGCVLRITPDNLTALVPVNGVATAALAIPPALALVGLNFGEQWVPLELGTGASIVAATSTNLLTLTIGVF